jgi:hypothetical protein
MQGSLPIRLFGSLPALGVGTSPVTPGGWSPVLLTNGDGTAITLGQVCYLSANDTARKAQSDGTEDEATAVCICIDASIAASAVGRFVFGGIVTGLSGGTAGDIGYLGTTPGAIVAAPNLTAGQYNVLLGIWQSASKFQFNPQLPILN